ncbi:MAG: flagellar hook protein FlgE [Bacillota bacterium]
MIRSLSTAVSGLRGHQIKLDVVGNNIANVNTVAFKKSQARFADLLSQTIQGATAPLLRGGINPSQVGMGMRISGILANHFQGSIQNTDRETDLAIEGAGYFVVSDGREEYYTRDGSFGRDSNGELVNVNGLKLMGYVNAEAGVTGELAPLHIPLGEKSIAKATTQIGFAGNLDTRAWVDPTGEVMRLDLGGADGGDYTLSDGTTAATLAFDADAAAILAALESIYGAATVTITGDSGVFEISFDPAVESSGLAFNGAGLTGAVDHGLSELQAYEPGVTASDTHSYEYFVFDSLGRRYTVDFQFTPTAQNTWSYEAFLGGGSIGSGELVFTTHGALNTALSTINNLTYAPPGAEPIQMSPDFSSATQLAGLNSLLIREQDGFPTGELVSFSIGRTGEVTGIYTNGMVESLGQIAIAFFTNPEGLSKEGANLYKMTANSGLARTGLPGSEGRGLIQSSALEMSNADLSFEFTELITTSRAFQANTRVVTTSDEILVEVINMKR